LHIFIPKGRYSGQKPVVPVSKVIPVKMSKTIAIVPVMNSVKYGARIAAASKNLNEKSNEPIFFIMFQYFQQSNE
jgi:hypothetical protein